MGSPPLLLLYITPLLDAATSQPNFKNKSAMAPCARASTTEVSHPNSKLDEHLFNTSSKYSFPDRVSKTRPAISDEALADPDEKIKALWSIMKAEARSEVNEEPILSTYYFTSILSHDSMQSALSNYVAMKLSSPSLSPSTLYSIFLKILNENQEIMLAVVADLIAVKTKDPACISYIHCFLNFKGFLACQAHRIAHNLWVNGRKILALLIQNIVSETFAVDIHPGARIGSGIMLDHATGVVIGETAVIGDNVAILHNVTLGGTGKEGGDRHPKIGDGVLIGAGTCILGNIWIEDGAKIGAGSVVLKGVPARTTAVGNPARLLGGKGNPVKMNTIPSLTMDLTSHIYEWSDYVI